MRFQKKTNKNKRLRVYLNEKLSVSKKISELVIVFLHQKNDSFLAFCAESLLPL